MTSTNQQKMDAAQAALAYVPEGEVIGVGTGSTVNYFIEALAAKKNDIEGAVASSDATEALLKKVGIPILDLNTTGSLGVYVDGADEVNQFGYMIKGGGAALTREKIVAEASRRFVCIVDESKVVPVLGEFPLPIEVIPMARAMVARKIVGLGGQPTLREGIETDNANVILDVRGLDLTNPPEMERTLNQIPGIVTNGIFALRGANIIIVGTDDGVDVSTLL